LLVPCRQPKGTTRRRLGGATSCIQAVDIVEETVERSVRRAQGAGRDASGDLKGDRPSAGRVLRQGPDEGQDLHLRDVGAVLREKSFARAEHPLAVRGEGEAIQHIRRRFQQQMADSFTSVIEQATGRKVRAFRSKTDIEQDVSVETFLLADDRRHRGRSPAVFGLVPTACASGYGWRAAGALHSVSSRDRPHRALSCDSRSRVPRGGVRLRIFRP
jgi:uncharacterized protein YbcI